jgi:uracil-DNA glycosylase
VIRVNAPLDPHRQGDERRMRALRVLHRDLDACEVCPKMIRPVVRGAAVVSRVLLLGQAPGPREGSFGKPFAWTAGKTMFGWFERELGLDEEQFRGAVYMAAVARCFPGKASGGGDRKPDPGEIERCEKWLSREVEILEPELVIAVGTLAIERVTGVKAPLAQIVGTALKAQWHGRDVDVIPLPHPSGASPWHRIEPGKTLLGKGLRLLARHPAMEGIRAAVG